MEIKKSKANNIIKILTALMLTSNILFCIVMLLYAYFDGCFILSIAMILVSFIPTLILYFISKKINYKTKNNLKICSIIISVVLLIILILFEFIGFIFYIFAQEIASIKPTRYRYTHYLSKMTKYTYKIEHFPQIIPNNAKDYSFVIERGGRGYWIHYLKFKTNEKYIQDTINKNKDDISKKIEFKNIDSYYKYIDNHFNIEDKDNASVYILKNKNNDEDYTSGIITSKSGEIVFFYANFDLKQ